jgi:cation diffusion facilitator family transporter
VWGRVAKTVDLRIHGTFYMSHGFFYSAKKELIMENSYKKVKRVLAVILTANLLVAALKIVIGLIVKSTSMTADGLHSLSDGSSNIVGLIGIIFASKPKDDSHPYGHNKFETMAGLFISAMLFAAGVKIITSAVSRLGNPVVPEITVTSLVVLIFTLEVNILVAVYEYRMGKVLGSQILIADSLHTRSDIYVSVGVLVTLICVKLGVSPVIDPIASLVVAGFIFYAAYEIFKGNSGVLVDKSAVDAEVIKSIVMSFEEVKDTHNIRSRGSISDLYIDLHILVDSELNIEKSHRLVHDIEDAIKSAVNKNAQVIVHLEPYEDT